MFVPLLAEFRPDMNKCAYLLILFLIIVIFPVHAGVVEKCVDSTGKITYTDKGCKGKETSQDSYLGKTNKSNLQKTSAPGYKVSEIGTLTEQAIVQCTKQAGKYFAGSRPGVTKNSKTEFSSVVDRSLRGAEVEIVLAGVILYPGKNAGEPNQEMKIQCAAKRSRESEWVLAFKEPG